MVFSSRRPTWQSCEGLCANFFSHLTWYIRFLIDFLKMSYGYHATRYIFFQHHFLRINKIISSYSVTWVKEILFRKFFFIRETNSTMAKAVFSSWSEIWKFSSLMWRQVPFQIRTDFSTLVELKLGKITLANTVNN